MFLAAGRLKKILPMRFGLFTSAQANSGDLPAQSGQGFRDWLELNVEAEALGLHASFLVEHHFTGWNQVSAPLMLLTALAMRTRTLRLGSAVMVLPWHNPVLLAEQAATLDLISGGRFDFGIGKGYRHSEFEGFRVDPQEAEMRFDEAVAVMTRAFTTRHRFTHHGRFWHFADVVVEPPPAQKPHPPFWAGAGSAPSIRRAAARGFNLILDQYASPAEVGRRIGLYKAERLRCGLGFDPGQVAVARQLYVARDEADKKAALARQAAYTQRTVAVSRAPQKSGGSHVLAYADRPGGTEEHALFGTPDEICEGLAQLRGAGAAYVLLTIAGGAAQLRRFATEIMPVFARPANAADAAE
jgi:alkanesulfonate monooxygenase SsuD/methylene tetrahydromethanopterin reductase-like flavin-dependent oxidoreductase (luciferase family)